MMTFIAIVIIVLAAWVLVGSITFALVATIKIGSISYQELKETSFWYGPMVWLAFILIDYEKQVLRWMGESNGN